MMFRNLQVYRLPAPYGLTPAQLIEALAPHAFAPCGASEMLRQGWVSPRDNDDLVHVVNKQMLLRLRTQKKILPKSVVNKVAAERAAEMEEQQGFPPGKKAMKELKERVHDELLPKAFSQDTDTWAWIDPVNGWLVVDAASATKADDVTKLLLKAVDRMPLESLRVKRSPVGMMTAWLQDDEAPAGFTMDNNATLRATGESKATVTYARHTLEPADIGRHIAAGKQCLRLAMTWESKISFVLTESLAIKAVKPLDVLRENSEVTRNDDERFDSDMTLMTGELAGMLADIVEALGGEADMDDMASPARTAVAPAGKAADPEHDGSGIDPLYEQAVTVAVTNQRASISLVQRHLQIGYNRAARLLELMEKGGVVSAMQSNGHRDVLIANGGQ